MNAIDELIRQVAAAGIRIRPDPPDLIVNPADRLTPDLEMRLRQHKAELLQRLQTCYAETQLSDSMRRLDHIGVCIAVWEDGSMRVLVTESDTIQALDDGCIYTPQD